MSDPKTENHRLVIVVTGRDAGPALEEIATETLARLEEKQIPVALAFTQASGGFSPHFHVELQAPLD